MLETKLQAEAPKPMAATTPEIARMPPREDVAHLPRGNGQSVDYPTSLHNMNCVPRSRQEYKEPNAQTKIP